MGEKDNGPSEGGGGPGAGGAGGLGGPGAGAGGAGTGLGVDKGPPADGGGGGAKPPARPSRAVMEGTYPDGYKMGFDDEKHWPTLTDPRGQQGIWDGENKVWVDPFGDPLPPGWGNDHTPFDTSPGQHPGLR